MRAFVKTMTLWVALAGCVPWAKADLAGDPDATIVDRPRLSLPLDGAARDESQSDTTAPRDVTPLTDLSGDTGVPNDLVTVDDSSAVDAGAPVDLPASDTPLTCGSLELACDGRCVAALHDPLNCGACDVACPAIAGATPTCMGGACGFACTAGYDDCNGRRSDGCEAGLATDHANCGGCGHACGESEQCTAGSCAACPATPEARWRWCGGATCVDRFTDPNNCSDCGNVCTGGRQCVEGTCAFAPCGVDAWMCGTECVHLLTDPAHCGLCDRRCPTGFVCRAGGLCEPVPCDAGMTPDAAGPPTGIVCDSMCIDMEYDPRNCGSCGHVCPLSQPYCENRTCRECPVVNNQQQFLCGTRCVDLGYDDNNCHTCGNVCAAGRHCQVGTCAEE